MGTALGKTLGAGCAANGIERLLDQQRLVTVQRVEAFQAFLQVSGKRCSLDLHGIASIQLTRLNGGQAAQDLLHDVRLHVAVQQGFFCFLGQRG